MVMNRTLMQYAHLFLMRPVAQVLMVGFDMDRLNGG